MIERRAACPRPVQLFHRATEIRIRDSRWRDSPRKDSRFVSGHRFSDAANLQKSDAPSGAGHPSEALPHSLPNLPRMMPPVHPMKLAPLPRRQRSQKRMVHNLRPRAEPAFTIREARAHLLQLSRNRVPHFFRCHAPRYSTRRSLASPRHIPQIHHQQSGKAILQRSARAQRSALFQALRQSVIGAFVRKQKVLQNLRGIPFSRRSLQQIVDAGPACCIFEFLPQPFEIGIHGVRSVQ